MGDSKNFHDVHAAASEAARDKSDSFTPPEGICSAGEALRTSSVTGEWSK
jgi:hypothetical protein